MSDSTACAHLSTHQTLYLYVRYDIHLVLQIARTATVLFPAEEEAGEVLPIVQSIEAWFPASFSDDYSGLSESLWHKNMRQLG